MPPNLGHKLIQYSLADIVFLAEGFYLMCAFQEIKFEPCVMCEHLDNRASFRISQVCASLVMLECYQIIRLATDILLLYSQIEDGDIICFQKSPPLEKEEDCRYPDVPSYLEYVHNRQVLFS